MPPNFDLPATVLAAYADQEENLMPVPQNFAPRPLPQGLVPSTSTNWLPSLGTVASVIGGAAGLVGGAQRNVRNSLLNEGDYGPPAPTVAELEKATGIKCKRRRRRRVLLTASDKGDIAFLKGTLGGGELGRAAITALLSRRM